MRTFLLAFLMLTMTFAGCLSGSEEPTAGTEDPLEEGVEVWDTNWDTLGGDLTIHIDPTVDPEPTTSGRVLDGPFITGEGTYTIRNNRDVDMPYVLFFGDFAIEVTDEDGNALEVDGNNVTLTGAVSPGAVRTLHVTFEGRSGDAKVPVSGADEFSAHYFGAAPYTSGSTTKSFLHANVTVPTDNDWVVLLAAEVVSTEESGDELKQHYFSLVPYFRGFAGEGLESLQDEVNGVQVRTYFYPSQQNQGEGMHDNAIRLLEVVEEWTGPYPFDHLWTVPHHVDVNAFSVPGMNFMGWTFYRPGAAGAPVQFGRDLVPIFGQGENSMENVLVHETIHNWWGHVVRGNNSGLDDGERDTWMTEGITTYLAETVWFDRMYGEEAAKDSADHMVRALQTGGGERSTTESGGDYYVKGALSMRALEAYGIATDRPDLTFDLLKHAAQVHGRQYGGSGYADTRDFVKTFEEKAGEDLSWWYDAWHYSRELSDFTIRSVQVGAEGLEVEVENLGGARGAALVEVEFASGESVRQWTVLNATSSETLVIELDDLDVAPVTATIDPLQYIYESDEQNNVWAIEDAPA